MYVVLVPVKPPALGKSRLVGLPGPQRRDLAAAFALDTIAVARSTPAVDRVLAITDDFRFAATLAEAGCEVLPDGVSGNLNATLEQAALEARRQWPDLRPVALCADLPALLVADLSEALRFAAGTGPAFVADEAGVGTSLYTAEYADFAPHFGTSSRQAHLDGGAVEVPGPLVSLRLDVDDVGSFGRALALGVGPRTAEAAGRRST